MRWIGALVVFAIGCTSPRAPERELRCSLDPALEPFTKDAESITCGNLASNGNGPPDCADRVREAAKNHRSFVAVWNQPQWDGVILRHAVAGRSEDAGYELRWFEYQYTARCGPPGNCGDRSHEGWTSRRCASIDEKFTCIDPTPAQECRD